MQVKKCSIDPKGQRKQVQEKNAQIVRIVKLLRKSGASQEDICNAIDCYITLV